MSVIAGNRTYRLLKHKVGKKYLFYARLICPETGTSRKTISTGQTAVHAVEEYLDPEVQLKFQGFLVPICR